MQRFLLARPTLISTLFAFAGLAAKDLLGIRPRTGGPAEHLLAAEAWLKRAQDQGADDGVSYGYSIRGGWRPSYRETSGYIATTFFNLARHHNDPGYRDRAIRICRWLLSVQNQDGSFSNPRYGDAGIVFDTGQDLFGLVRAFEETGEAIFKDGASRAAQWLVNIADAKGIWTRNEHLNTPHVYNSRTAWAVLRMNQVEYSAERERVARANLDWALSEQQPSGFFDECAFERGLPPFTHTIAYATRGLLESGELLKDQRYIDGAKRCADAALGHLKEDGFLPGQIAIDGTPAATYCCVTGNCQFSIVWSKLFARTHDDRYRAAVIRALDYVMRCQDISTSNLNIHGAIKGSQPIWGRYAPLSFPNWPAKFFVDAMLLRKQGNYDNARPDT
jgi:Squalene-hopene cyclase C-terminal domain